jgi:hypothetical protein
MTTRMASSLRAHTSSALPAHTTPAQVSRRFLGSTRGPADKALTKSLGSSAGLEAMCKDLLAKGTPPAGDRGHLLLRKL